MISRIVTLGAGTIATIMGLYVAGGVSVGGNPVVTEVAPAANIQNNPEKSASANKTASLSPEASSNQLGFSNNKNGSLQFGYVAHEAVEDSAEKEPEIKSAPASIPALSIEESDPPQAHILPPDQNSEIPSAVTRVTDQLVQSLQNVDYKIPEGATYESLRVDCVKYYSSHFDGNPDFGLNADIDAECEILLDAIGF